MGKGGRKKGNERSDVFLFYINIRKKCMFLVFKWLKLESNDVFYFFEKKFWRLGN